MCLEGIACLLPPSNLCVCALKSDFFNGSVNSTRVRLCGILPSYPLPELELHGGCITTAPCVLEQNWQGDIWVHICVPGKLAILTECNCDPEEIRVSLVLESFSKEPCVFGKNRLPEITESKPASLLLCHRLRERQHSSHQHVHLWALDSQTLGGD